MARQPFWVRAHLPVLGMRIGDERLVAPSRVVDNLLERGLVEKIRKTDVADPDTAEAESVSAGLTELADEPPSRRRRRRSDEGTGGDG